MNASHITIQKAYITLAAEPQAKAIQTMTLGAISAGPKDFLHPDPSRFSSEPRSGIVNDPVTGLMWAQTETDGLDWEAAAQACAECRLGGYSDWRMPTRAELLTILDLERHDPALPPLFQTHGGYVWTSTQTSWTKDEAGSSRSFFVVYMHYGYVNGFSAHGRLRARPVRRASPASQCLVLGL